MCVATVVPVREEVEGSLPDSIDEPSLWQKIATHDIVLFWPKECRHEAVGYQMYQKYKEGRLDSQQ